jgi:SOS-response transcriptional repressor LexA
MPHPCPTPVDDPLHPRDVLTPRQAEVFTYVFEATRKTGIQPTARDLCKTFGFKSVRSSDLYVNVLAKKGWIAHPDGATVVRALRFLRTPAGTPFRGFVLPADEDGS